MRIETTAGELAYAIATAEHAVKGSSGGDASVSIVAETEGIRSVGSDGELTITVGVAGVCVAPGRAAVIPRPLAAYAAALAEDVRLTCYVEGARLAVKGGGRTYWFSLVEAATIAVSGPGEGSSTIDARSLQSLYAACRHGVDPRTQLIKLSAGDGELRMYATDSYRLVSAAISGIEGAWSILLPAPALTIALRHSPQQLVVDQRGRVATFRGANVETTVRLGAGVFPAVEGVIAAVPAASCELSTTALVGALQRISSVAGNEPLLCEIEPTRVVLTAASAEGSGTESVATDAVETISFGIGAKNLRDAIQACETERVVWAYSSGNAPVHLMRVGGEVSVVCVVMPIVWAGVS